jgi:hypothetical protein
MTLAKNSKKQRYKYKFLAVNEESQHAPKGLIFFFWEGGGSVEF